jgi:hypothetical protein
MQLNDLKPIFLGLMIAALACAQAGAEEPALRSHPARADFRGDAAPMDVRRMANWVVSSADNGSLPFAIIDKKEADVFVFDSEGQILGFAPVLLGLGVGDDSAPGIGSKPLSAIPPRDRTTPAGRFVATLGHEGKTPLLWVDYKNNIAMHRVVKGTPKDHRLQRLATPTPLDNRISFGCINVPIDFFDRTLLPAFKSTRGVVYILPEVKAMRDVFPHYHDVDG